MTGQPYASCAACMSYAAARRPVLAPAFADTSLRTGEDPVALIDRYMTGVHQRHLDGLPLLKEES